MPKPLGVSCPSGIIPTLLGEKTTSAFTAFAFSTNTGCINSELTLTLICLTTTLNHLLFENTFKQFYKEVYYTKPQIRDALKKKCDCPHCTCDCEHCKNKIKQAENAGEYFKKLTKN